MRSWRTSSGMRFNDWQTLRKENGQTAIVRHHPSIGVQVEFPFDCAWCAMKTSQILFRLFQHTSRQLALACLRYVSVDRVHFIG